MRPTVGTLLDEARRRLRQAPFQPSTREASLLMGWVLGLSEAQVLARSQQEISGGAARRFREMLSRRLRGEPVAYLTGEREFYGRSFRVDRRVLIPRPETEHLVEQALAQQLPDRAWILDVGTGSGCLAVTLALERADARIVASDISPAALAVARANARRHGAGARVRLIAADLLPSLALARFDLVVSNPPYVGSDEAGELSPEVRDYEPGVALFAPEKDDPLLGKLIDEGRNLRPGAAMILEIGRGQLPRLRRLLKNSRLLLERVVDDYAGIPRIVVLRRSP